MKKTILKILNHIAKNLPVYVMILLIFFAFCSYLNVSFETLKEILRRFIKVISFIAFVITTAYLFFDVINTVEGKGGIVEQNKARIQELEGKKEETLKDMLNAEKIPAIKNTLKAISPQLEDKERDFYKSKLDDAGKQQTELRNQIIETWKWKIITLITLNGMFISIAKFF